VSRDFFIEFKMKVIDDVWSLMGSLLYMPVVREKMRGTLLDVEEATVHAFSYMMDEKASHQHLTE